MFVSAIRACSKNKGATHHEVSRLVVAARLREAVPERASYVEATSARERARAQTGTVHDALVLHAGHREWLRT